MAATKKPSSPFAALGALRDGLPPGPRQQQGLTRAESAAQFEAEVTVSRPKKDADGKVVTAITGVREAARESLAHELRRTFGCEVRVEGDAIVIEGDQRPRTRAFLEARGVRKVIVGA